MAFIWQKTHYIAHLELDTQPLAELSSSTPRTALYGASRKINTKSTFGLKSGFLDRVLSPSHKIGHFAED